MTQEQHREPLGTSKLLHRGCREGGHSFGFDTTKDQTVLKAFQEQFQ